jgi:hypothetical protein
MANLDTVRRKSIKVVLTDGVEREIKFTLNTMAELEDKYGSVEDAFKVLEKGSIKALRFVLWAALQHENESLTERQIGDLIDMKSMGTLMEALNQATAEDMPNEEANNVVPMPTKVDPN